MLNRKLEEKSGEKETKRSLKRIIKVKEEIIVDLKEAKVVRTQRDQGLKVPIKAVKVDPIRDKRNEKESYLFYGF